MRSRNARAVVAFVLMLSFVALSLSACSKQQTGTQAVKEVRVGLVLPLTGTQAAIGELCRRGHDLALEEWNEKGGIKSLGGAKLVYVVGDAQSDVQTARSETERLIVKEKVVAVTGAYATALSYGATEIAEKYRVPFVVDAGVGDDITQRGFKYTFRTCCTAWDYARTSFDLMQNMIKPKKVGIIVENSLYGQSVGKHLQKLCQDAGLDIVVNEAYDAKTVDFAPIVIKVKQAQPEVLLVAQYINDAIQLTNQLAQQGAKVNAIIGNGAGHTMPDYVRGCSGNAEGVFATGAWAPDIKWPEVPAYVQRYKDKYNDMPEQQGAISYLASWVLFDAIERAGSVEPEKITEALRSTNLSSSISGPIKFNDNGQVSVQPPCMQIQQGRFVTVWPPELAAGQPIYPVPGTK